MALLTVVGFASGSPQSQAHMARLARDHRLAAIVMPRLSGGLIRRARGYVARVGNPLASLGVPLVDATEVERLRPDLILVASYPHIIPVAVLAEARIGALNVHLSLLPRHRGVDPLFWTYWDDDQEAGVTVHWMNERLDAGDIAAQEALPVVRGLASRELYMQLTARGVDRVADVLAQIEAGNSPRIPQDESLATYESAADIARVRVPFAKWPAERVWHVLSGLGDQRSHLLADAEGRALAHGRATGYRIAAGVEPGHVSLVPEGYEIHCRDGIVVVQSRS